MALDQEEPAGQDTAIILHVNPSEGPCPEDRGEYEWEHPYQIQYDNYNWRTDENQGTPYNITWVSEAEILRKI